MAKSKRVYRSYDHKPGQFMVYWIYDRSCTSPERHGYVGVTGSPKREIPRAMHRFRVTTFKILLRGSKKKCYDLENKLRPKFNIGWNQQVGGFGSGQGGKGLPKSKLHRQRIAKSTKRRWSDPKSRKVQSIAVKKGLRDIDRTGKKNAMYGRKHSAKTKAKISASQRARLLSLVLS